MCRNSLKQFLCLKPEARNADVCVAEPGKPAESSIRLSDFTWSTGILLLWTLADCKLALKLSTRLGIGNVEFVCIGDFVGARSCKGRMGVELVIERFTSEFDRKMSLVGRFGRGKRWWV